MEQPGCYLTDRGGQIVEVFEQSLITVVLCHREFSFSIDSKLMKNLLKDVSDELPNLDDLIDMSRNITVYSKKNMHFNVRNGSKPVEIDLDKRAIQKNLPVPNLFSVCSHSRAIQYFLESMRDNDECQFMGTQCASWDLFTREECSRCGKNQMGFFALKPKEPSVYYLNVNSEMPFCLRETNTSSSRSTLIYCSSANVNVIYNRLFLSWYIIFMLYFCQMLLL
jgi:hypothetical protein